MCKNKIQNKHYKNKNKKHKVQELKQQTASVQIHRKTN